ncbi:MAG: DUF1330 domain-containing protein [Chloroflexota bacterium]
MPAYLFAEIDIRDPKGYEEYRAGARVATEQYGGRVIARTAEAQVLEGSGPGVHAVIIEFPSLEALQAWYDSPEYAEPKAIRARTTVSRVVALPGA